SVRAPVARPILNRTLLAGLQALRLLVGGESLDELVELALENLVETPDGETDAVIGDPVLLVVVGPDLLRPLPRAHLRPALPGELSRSPLLLRLQQPGPEDAERLLLVLQLRLLVLDRDDEPGGDVGEPHRRVGGVDRLPARPGRPVHVDPDVVGIDLHV